MRENSVDLAVVGAGSGGLSVAAGAAQLGLEVVLLERGRMGGERLNTGCVPSKALIAAATAAHASGSASRLGVHVSGEAGFAAVMAHVRDAITAIEPHDSQARFEGLGVEVVRRAARFVGPRILEAGDRRVRARRIVIATGSRSRLPDVPGLRETPHLTNETVFDLPVRPERLLVIGAGPVGLELGQAFRRLGSEVTIIEAAEPLAGEDRDMVEPLLRQLAQDGVRLLSRAEILRAEAVGEAVRLLVMQGGRTETLDGSHLLVAAGRAPNIEDLDLPAGRVDFTRRGVTTDSSLRSVSNPAVFAVGDVAGREALAHAAAAQAAVIVRGDRPQDCVRTAWTRRPAADPSRHLYGPGGGQRRPLGSRGDRPTWGGGANRIGAFADNDRAVTEADTRGLAKLVLGRCARVLGVSIVGPQAGELIQTWALVMQAGVPLRELAGAAPPYPTRGEINKRLASLVFGPLLFSARTRALVRLLKRLG